MSENTPFSAPSARPDDPITYRHLDRIAIVGRRSGLGTGAGFT
jgi:hypothetical protein